MNRGDGCSPMTSRVLWTMRSVRRCGASVVAAPVAAVRSAPSVVSTSTPPSTALSINSRPILNHGGINSGLSPDPLRRAARGRERRW